MGLLKVENLVVLKADRKLMAVHLVELIWNFCFYF